MFTIRQEVSSQNTVGYRIMIPNTLLLRVLIHLQIMLIEINSSLIVQSLMAMALVATSIYKSLQFYCHLLLSKL